MRTKIRAYRKTNFVLIRKFTDYLHRFFIVLKGGAMEEFTKELLDQLNVDTRLLSVPLRLVNRLSSHGLSWLYLFYFLLG